MAKLPLMNRAHFLKLIKSRKLSASQKKDLEYHFYVQQHLFRGEKPKQLPAKWYEEPSVFRRFHRKLKSFESSIRCHPEFQRKIKSLIKYYPSLGIFLFRKNGEKSSKPMQVISQNDIDLMRTAIVQFRRSKTPESRFKKLKAICLLSEAILCDLKKFEGSRLIVSPPSNKPKKAGAERRLYDLCQEFKIAFFQGDKIIPWNPFSISAGEAIVYFKLEDYVWRALIKIWRRFQRRELKADNAEVDKNFHIETARIGDVPCIRMKVRRPLSDLDFRRLIKEAKMASNKLPEWEALLEGKRFGDELNKYHKRLMTNYEKRYRVEKHDLLIKTNKELQRLFGTPIRKIKNARYYSSRVA